MSRNPARRNVSGYASSGHLRNIKDAPSRSTAQTYSTYQETVATGGESFYALSGNVLYKYHVFNNPGTFEFNVLNSGTYGTKFDIFVVSAGGAGGSGRQASFPYGGGGGSGEIKQWYNQPLSIGVHTVEVGAGGVVNPGLNGGNGGNSSLDKTFLSIGGEGGKSNGEGGLSGNGKSGGIQLGGLGGAGGGSFRQGGFESGQYSIDVYSGAIYSDYEYGGMGGSGSSFQEFTTMLSFNTKFGSSYYTENYFCFGGGGSGNYGSAAADYYNPETGIYISGYYYASQGATLNYSNPAYIAFSPGSGGGGGGQDSYGQIYEAANGTEGFVIIRYPTNPSFRVPVTFTYDPLINDVVFEQGLPVSTSFYSYAYPEQITYSVTSGSLPTGISLSEEGTLYGTPTIANQNYSFTITATNGYSSATSSKSGTIAAFSITSVSGAFSDTTSSGVRTIVWRGAGSLVIGSGAKDMEVMVLGGGGSGGLDCGGGGGGGALYYNASRNVIKGTHSVVVGAGGAKSTNPTIRGGNGGTSTFGSISANGGGGGGSWSSSYGAYPSGGGGSWGGSGGGRVSSTNYFSSAGGNAAPYYALPDGGYYFAMGGGGGATFTGAGGTTYTQNTSTYGTGGNGGTGKLLFGTVYADGGGGGADAFLSRAQSQGGSGNGGRGQTNGSSSSMDAVSHTGSGGGGSVNSGAVTMIAGNGSAGIVIIRFAV